MGSEVLRKDRLENLIEWQWLVVVERGIGVLIRAQMWRRLEVTRVASPPHQCRTDLLHHFLVQFVEKGDYLADCVVDLHRTH